MFWRRPLIVDWFPFGARVVLASLATSKGGVVASTDGRAGRLAEGDAASQVCIVLARPGSTVGPSF